jgi:hypothetical protein
VIHPFHPWSGREFAFVARRHTWKQDRVFFIGDDAVMESLPTAWTDAAAPDVFVSLAAGRSALRVEDLLVLVDVLDGLLAAPPSDTTVRRTSPDL